MIRCNDIRCPFHNGSYDPEHLFCSENECQFDAKFTPTGIIKLIFKDRPGGELLDIQDSKGRSIRVGVWKSRGDLSGNWVLEVPVFLPKELKEVMIEKKE